MKLIFASAAALALSSASGFAQMNSKVTVSVPFEFLAGSATMPPGNYDFHEDANGVVLITSAEQRKSAVVLTNAEPADWNRGTTAPSVKFEKADGTYWLTSVTMTGEPIRRVIYVNHSASANGVVAKLGVTNGASKGLKK